MDIIPFLATNSLAIYFFNFFFHFPKENQILLMLYIIFILNPIKKNLSWQKKSIPYIDMLFFYYYSLFLYYSCPDAN